MKKYIRERGKRKDGARSADVAAYEESIAEKERWRGYLRYQWQDERVRDQQEGQRLSESGRRLTAIFVAVFLRYITIYNCGKYSGSYHQT